VFASGVTCYTRLFQDIQKFLDDSEHGVIYFSLGSWTWSHLFQLRIDSQNGYTRRR